jgi:tRNA A22 N-methylase
MHTKQLRINLALRWRVARKDCNLTEITLTAARPIDIEKSVVAGLGSETLFEVLKTGDRKVMQVRVPSLRHFLE